MAVELFGSARKMLTRRGAAALLRPRCAWISRAAMSASSKLSLERLAATQSLRGQRVLVRADLNVPMKKNQVPPVIADDTRIRAVLPTLRLLQEHGAKTILCSHLGRPGGQVKESLRMAPIGARLRDLLYWPVTTLNDCVGDAVAKEIDEMDDGDIVLLENVRFYKEETENDDAFAKKLAHGASIYVNDAFGTAHRAHASTEGVTKHIKTCVAGLLMEKELKYLAGAVEAPTRPLGAVIGGAKVSTKLPVLKSLLNKCDKILLGGGMIFTFFKAQGLNVGKSLVEDNQIELAREIMAEAEKKGVQLVLPIDVVVADAFEADAYSKVVDANEIPADWIGMDIGPETRCEFEKELSECRTIVWNGPMGVFEFPQFEIGTIGLAESLMRCTEAGATTVVGGGDSVAAVEAAHMTSHLSHISTGGGASLELLEGKPLPGVAALQDAPPAGSGASGSASG